MAPAAATWWPREGPACWWMPGPAPLPDLQRHLDPASIDAVFISHHHPDHWTDLYALATHARFVLGRTGIPVYAPAGWRAGRDPGLASLRLASGGRWR